MKKFLLVNYTSPTTYANEVPYLWLTLKSYFQKHSKNPSEWEWLDPIHSDISDSSETLIQDIVKQNPDVLGISCYMWNDKLTMFVAREVKRILPNIKIIAGGPALYYEHDKGWFVNNSYIDVVCEYAAYGEVFITDYLDGIPVKDIPFAVYPSLRGAFWNTSTAEFVRRNFNYPTPYLDNIDYLKRLSIDKPKIILDTSRGCPYACSFCEWGGGTSTKTVFKPVEDTLLELDLIFDILKPHYVDIINANFGIIKDDIVVAQKIVELHKKYNCVKQVNLYGPTKTNKKNLKEIFRLFSEAGIMSDIKVSIQSTTQVALDNINRIDMPYDDQIELYNDLCTEYGVQLKVETMLGLPGETLDTFYHMMGELTKSELLYPMVHEWMMLPSAPAAKPEYIEKFKILTKRVKYTKEDSNTNYITKNQYGVIKENTGIRHLLLDQQWTSPYEVVVSTYSYSIEDWIEMELFKYYFTFLAVTNIITPIQKYLRNKNVDLADFNKTFFREFLLSIPTIKKIYTEFIKNVKSDEPSDIFYADLGGNLPYFSHYSTLKFLILINPKMFFDHMENWLIGKYGEDNNIRLLIQHLCDNISTPMTNNKPQTDKIKECISMCSTWSGSLFFDDFVPKY